MSAVRVRGHFRINQRSPRDIRYLVYERVMNAAVRYMDHAMGARFKQPELGCTQATADSESSAVAKSGSWSGNDLHRWQSMSARQLIQYDARAEPDARLTEPRATGAWRPMRAHLQQSLTDMLNPSTGPLSPFLSEQSILCRQCAFSYNAARALPARSSLKTGCRCPLLRTQTV
jgi:hypothetical protein